METAKLKKFAQSARRSLMEQVSTKLKLVLAENSAARRERAEAVKKLEEAIEEHGKAQVIERVAYIWFNRFCALRFMDVNRYNRINIVSPAESGQFQPEILAEAKMGHIDEKIVPEKVRQQVSALLGGKAPSHDPQGEAYRLLVVAACNFWNQAMPFLFQKIDDYTELLMPDDLLSEHAILAHTREAMTPDACEDVEVIGWLYQFYISEKKDEVFDGLKKNKKITPENIPAATQLFTPHWIVRYLVENSLGRLWLLNRPGSKLAAQMDYYIEPEQAETDFLRISKPEELRICDPACGSGHMLTYAFDLLYAIYEEEGYAPADIPEKILTHNLYGIEIDERAGELAAFALAMKARAKQRRFFNRKAASGGPVAPNICVLSNIHFDGNELKDYMDFVGRDRFTAPLQTTLRQFEEADNFGSLIRPEVTDVTEALTALKSQNLSGQLLRNTTHQKVLKALQQADYLSPKYHVVIANPPYMGSEGMNQQLAGWAKKQYPICWGDRGRSDLFALFIERGLCLTLPYGYTAMITMQNWMFLASFEKLRKWMLVESSILTMAHLGKRAFDTIGGAVVSTTAFVLKNSTQPNYKGSYLRLIAGNSEAEKSDAICKAVKNPDCGWFYRASATDFKKIPGNPTAYWVSDKIRDLFLNTETFETSFAIRAGMCTGKNAVFILSWPEVSFSLIRKDSEQKYKYTPHNKGGDFRKWIGNWDTVLKYSQQHLDAMGKNPGFRHDGKEYYFQEHIGWTKITSSTSSFRFYPEGFTFDSAGLALFSNERNNLYDAMGFLNSKISVALIELLNPTLNVTPQIIKRLPLIRVRPEHRDKYLELYDIAKLDWNSYETSWDFASLPLLDSDYRQATLEATYQKLRGHWREMTLEMQRLEEENNRIFIDAYGLQDELTPEVPLAEITLTCNPHYRYRRQKKNEECERSVAELEAMLLSDTMKELVSYAVGCMFGRYSLDKPGLILANAGESLEDYRKQVSQPTFEPDDDNVIPLMDVDWFTDDIAERFKAFLKVTFGETNYEENLRFLEDALGYKPTGKSKRQSIRDYFLKDFYNDHVTRYKKRPIYWMFSSPKGSFNALIYMHRYRPDTVSVVLNDYLREFRTKLTSRKSHLEAVSISGNASRSEKTKALKEIEKIAKMIVEIEAYEREVLYPLATEQVEIDLDDGVKTNYPKLGAALKKI